MAACMNIAKLLWHKRKLLVLVLTPILLCPLPIIIQDTAALCAYAVLIIAIYWMTEVLPIALTALLPVLLFPLLGVMHSAQVSANYMKDIIMTMIGAFFVADAMEHWNIHRRFALRILCHTASTPRWLMFGLMTTTSFLAMWMSNSVVTSMMVPLAVAILKEINVKRTESQLPRVANGDADLELQKDHEESKPIASVTSATEQTPASKSGVSDDDFKNLSKGLVLCVAYAANIGGTATLYGTSSNIVMTGQLESLYGYEATVDFGTWFAYGFPNQLIILIIAWLVLQWRFLDLRGLFKLCRRSRNRRRKHHVPSDAELIIRKQYAELGKMTWAEVIVLVHFIALSLLWLTYSPRFIPGWSSLFSHQYVTSSTATMAVVISLALIPSSKPNFLKCGRNQSFNVEEENADSSPAPAILDWRRASSNMRWEVIFLMGAGYAIADAFGESGLSDYLAEQFKVFATIPAWSLVIVCTVLIAILTEFISNTATAAVFLPIIGKMGESIGVNPHYLMIPTTVASSFAFMLPIATPPNAIAFSYGTLTVMDMVKCGLLINLASLVVVNLTINTFGVFLFDLNTYPAWAGGTTIQPSLTENISLVSYS
ncbi:Na(+)/citrate cotransporter-like [Ptychodera flava]|uniref:Na(+)/citrate cotransporter-like n=1 Tax=Ptychodera flava TaxID=63121 RepID=UPI003969D197